MIGNIKRLVNEHQTLIVVVIGVLVISYLYWFLCCRDGVRNVVKGGVVSRDVLEIKDQKVILSSGKNVGKFGVRHCIGVVVKKTDAVNAFYVLSAKGEEEVNNHYWGRLTVEVFNDYIEAIFKYPIQTILGHGVGSGRPIQVCLRKEAKKYIKHQGGKVCLAGKIFEKSTFDCNEIIGKTKNKKVDSGVVLEYIAKVNKFLEDNAGDLVDDVDYIGQYALLELNDAGLKSGCRFGTKSSIVKGEKVIGERAFRVSPPMNQGLFTDEKAKRIYEVADGDVRSWYSTQGKGFSALLSGTLEYDTKGVIRTTRRNGGVADIYPAHKVIMFVMFLIMLFPEFERNYKEKNGKKVDINIIIAEYSKMMAAYVLTTQLFNSICGIKMESGWNTNIGNGYVYRYRIVNVPKKTTMNKKSTNALESELFANYASEMTKEASVVGSFMERRQRSEWINGLTKASECSQKTYEEECTSKICIFVLCSKKDLPKDLKFYNFKKIADCTISIAEDKGRKSGKGKKIKSPEVYSNFKGAMFFGEDLANKSLNELIELGQIEGCEGYSLISVFEEIHTPSCLQLMFEKQETYEKFNEILGSAGCTGQIHLKKIFDEYYDRDVVIKKYEDIDCKFVDSPTEYKIVMKIDVDVNLSLLNEYKVGNGMSDEEEEEEEEVNNNNYDDADVDEIDPETLELMNAVDEASKELLKETGNEG